MNKTIIYREDAIEAIRRLPNAGTHWYISARAVFDVLFELPSAQPDPSQCWGCNCPKMNVQSKTTQRTIERDGQTHWYKCLKCGAAVDLMDKFCRGCGRKFEEER